MKYNPYYVSAVTIIVLTIFTCVALRFNRKTFDKGVNMVAASIVISGLIFLLLTERVDLYLTE